MGIPAVDRAPAEMVAEPGSCGSLDEPLEALKVFGIGLAGGAEVHRNAVLHHFVLIENLVENFERSASIDHVVFRDDLKPVHHRFSGQDVPIVRNPKADSDSILGKAVEAICWHRNNSWG